MTLSKSHTVVSMLAAAGSLTICLGFGRFSLSLLLPDMKTGLGLTYSQAGALASINLAGYLVGIAAMPLLSRRIPHVVLLRSGVLMAAVGMGMLAFPSPFAVLAVALGLTGVAGAFAWIASSAIGSALSSTANRGRRFGLLGSANGLGIIIASLLALILVNADGIPWRWVWACQAALAIPALIFAVLTPTSVAADALPLDRTTRRLAGLKWAYGIFGLGYGWFATYFVASISTTGGASAALIWSIIGIGALFGAPLLGAWSDRWGRRRVLVASQLMAALASLIMVVYLPAIPAAIVSGLLFGLVFTGMASLIPSALADRVGPQSAASAFASLTLVFAGVQTITPITGGFVIDHVSHGFSVLFAGAAVTFLIAAALFHRAIRPSSVHR